MMLRTSTAGLLVLLAPSLALAQSSTLARPATAPVAAAQPAGDDWTFRATVYGFFPDITGAARFPTGTSRDINVDAGTLLDNTEIVAMGAFEVQKGRGGAFVDVIFMNVATTKTATRELAIDGVPLPVNVTANADVDIKAPVTTMAANIRLASTPVVTFDVFGGARFLAAKATLDWEFSTEVGGIGGPGRVGASEVKNHVWDGIGGVKGRVNFGPGGRVFIPFYADIGAGQSDLTWQVMAGAGVDFGWAEVTGAWRHLDYEMKSDRNIDTLTFNGPVAGVTFHW